MKKFIAIAILSFVFGFLPSGSERKAEALVGMMCINTAACGDKCEVCVKAKDTDPTGKCMKISGCY